MNGSSANGNCSSVTTSTLSSLSRCNTPNSSVLFDGSIPITLAGLDGDVLASQLLTLQTTDQFSSEIIFYFEYSGYAGVGRFELVMFHCPEWGISVQAIRLLTASSISGARSAIRTFIVPAITSCESLVRICIKQDIEHPVIGLEIINAFIWTHLAEVTFYGSGSCPPDTVITTSPPPDPDSTSPSEMTTATSKHACSSSFQGSIYWGRQGSPPPPPPKNAQLPPPPPPPPKSSSSHALYAERVKK